LDNINKNELLDEIGSDIEMRCRERDDEIEEDNIFASSQHLQRLDVLGSRTRLVFPPLPDFNLDLICDIISF
jgi:hypothetical protein